MDLLEAAATGGEMMFCLRETTKRLGIFFEKGVCVFVDVFNLMSYYQDHVISWCFERFEVVLSGLESFLGGYFLNFFGGFWMAAACAFGFRVKWLNHAQC